MQVVGAGGLSAAAPRTPTSSAAHHEHHAGAGQRHGPAMLLREFVPCQDKLKDYMQSWEGGVLQSSREKHFTISTLLNSYL